MGIRHSVGSALDRLAGPERTAGVRRAERKIRRGLITMLDVEGSAAPAKRKPAGQKPKKGGPKKKAPAKLTRARRIELLGRQPEGFIPKAPPVGWASPAPSATFPTPTVTRHQLLAGLHEVLSPRTYFEVGVSTGRSMTISRTRSLGVDPFFTVQQPLQCDVQLVREESDSFFARADAFDHLGGTPVDLAFLDGMHLSEFLLRDFMNAEKHMATTGVVLLDDMLPRNNLEAYRIRRTSAWTGDVYKVHEVLTRYRPDLTLIPVNTSPTGTYLIVGLDPTNTVLDDNLAEIEASITGPDPQEVPLEWRERRTAVDPQVLLNSDAWKRLVELRDGGTASPDELAGLWSELAALAPTGESSQETAR
ncbi:class I SAM-dependent methyltransferase [Nocardioides insulae]|uniref:class I SAM-dependent methyltransferase n=1 Tax=Nocardioides insulae TaxID=394734 RepID=UPI0004173690|nr:class I SAM-dependent methyltransferase [Nocardioides insulae]